MKVAFALGLIAVFAVAYETAQYLRRRANVEVDAPVWSRALTIVIVAACFAVRVPFSLSLGLTCAALLLSQSLVWRASARVVTQTEKPRLVWAAAALESTGIILVVALGLVARGVG